jgi:hypothetical protein
MYWLLIIKYLIYYPRIIFIEWMSIVVVDSFRAKTVKYENTE